MAIANDFTRSLSLQHPIVLAPMGGSAGGVLAAAVSNGGGLGMVGGGYGYRERLARELPLVARHTDRSWGVGFIAWAVQRDDVAYSLEFRPPVVMLSFGDPSPLAGLIRDSGARLMVQVVSLDEAKRALDAGADYLVAQGTEAGGHGGRRATLPFVPAVVDIAGSTPVLGAGGIADGRGLAAVLALGASGALMGSRFLATRESLATPTEITTILDGTGDNTDRSQLIDIAVGTRWPEPYTIRALRNRFLDTWQHREDELEADETAKHDFHAALERGDRGVVPVAVGEAVDLITEVSSASDLVPEIVVAAEAALARARGLV
jgi:nitronate monooxygenase